MHVLDANEIFGMTFYTYDRILEEGGKNGPDALALYIKLLKQTRIQETNQTYTLNQFLLKSFGWGHERLAKAKNTLKNLGLVDDVLIRAEDGKLQGHYVRVNYLIDEQNVRTSAMTYNLTDSLENRQSVSTECGQTAANALSTQYINAGSTQLKNNCPKNDKKTTTSKKVVFTPEQNEMFEALRKEYPIKSKKELARKHFLEHDYNELMFDAKIRKRKVELEVVEKQYMRGGGRRMEDFAPQGERMKNLDLKEIFEKHMTMGGDMRTRMEELKADFPDVDFEQLHKERSDKKTENAIGHLIHGK